jgi:hypothetical protein
MRRFGRLVPGSLLIAFALAAPIASADVSTPMPADVPGHGESTTFKPRAARKSAPSDIDGRVLAALLASATQSDFEISMRVTEIACSNNRTCNVALTVKLPESVPPSRLAFAVAGPKGVLSEVRHADCLTSVCNVTLLVERGRNTIAVGVANELAQTAAFATTGVNAKKAPPKPSGPEWF